MTLAMEMPGIQILTNQLAVHAVAMKGGFTQIE